ncbi:MAG: galactose mutarotase [Clostridia bacterium]|nr:galactose mutarotase [Clostridia bacterium]
MKIRVEPFGKIKSNLYQKYTLENASGAFVQITDYSGAIVALNVPDKKGKLDNVVLGFPSVRDYANNPGYLGALIGPVGNRINGAAFTFNGKDYAFEANENGTTLLHSGAFGFHTHGWDAVAEADENEAKLILTSEFKEAETLFPGNITACVTYTFNNANELKINYQISSDTPTFVSPTNHTYFNIAGLSAKRIPSIERQKIEIFADHYTTVDEKCIPTGTASVENTPFDLRKPVKIADGHANEETNEQMKIGSGYDHNFVLSGEIDPETGLRLAARVTDQRTGRIMKVYTDMPSVQFYAGNHLNRFNSLEKRYYKPRHGLCLETQAAPDSIHREGEFGFDVAIVEPGKPFSSTTVYAFSAE